MSQKPTASYSSALFADANIPFLVPIVVDMEGTTATSETLQFPYAVTITGLGLLCSKIFSSTGDAVLTLLTAADVEKMFLNVPTGTAVGQIVSSLKDNSSTTIDANATAPFYQVAADTAFKLKTKTAATSTGQGYAILYIRPTVE
jgi:hypothetical protein